MRQDISVDPEHGEVNLNRQITSKRIELFRYLDEVIDENYSYGEILTSQHSFNNGDMIHVHIPYIPVFKPLKIRLKINNEGYRYFYNPKDNSTWFLIKNDTGQSPPVCSFRNINDNEDFTFVFQNGYLIIYSMYDSDLMITPSLSQDKIFLLKANASNLYQFPKTGVGLINFLHGNFENTGLATKLQQEFEADGLTITNAKIDSSTGDLYIEVRESNG